MQLMTRDELVRSLVASPVILFTGVEAEEVLVATKVAYT